MRTLPTAESLTVEFETELHGGLSDGDIVLAVVCLAQGGALYLGVEDDGGLADRYRDPSRIAAMILNTTQPPQGVHVSIIENDCHQVAEIQVDRRYRPVSNQKGASQRRRLLTGRTGADAARGAQRHVVLGGAEGMNLPLYGRRYGRRCTPTIPVKPTPTLDHPSNMDADMNMLRRRSNASSIDRARR